MDKKATNVIREVIKSLLEKRFMVAYEKSGKDLSELYRNKQAHKDFNRLVREKGLYEALKIDPVHTKFYDRQLIKLNNILEVEEKNQEVLEIEKQMAKLQSKKYITVKQFTEIYSYSSDWQKNRRGRIHDPLPFRQDGLNKKISYVVNDIENWFENNNIGR